MPERRPVSVPVQFLDEAAQDLVDYFVAFCRITDADTPPDAHLTGSGTLVTIDRTHAILTADHVIQSLPDAGAVGLIFLRRAEPRLHRMTIRMELVQKLRVGRGSNESAGPDLALLVLPPSDAAIIQGFESFCNLTRRREQILAQPQSTGIGAWYLCGMAHEWTDEAEPDGGYGRVKRFCGLCALTEVTAEWADGDFDYLKVGVRYGDGYQGPRSFEGFSGGGLWQLLIGHDGTTGPAVLDRILSGVAFYQSALEADVRGITCHGRRSTYGQTIDVIRNRSVA